MASAWGYSWGTVAGAPAPAPAPYVPTGDFLAPVFDVLRANVSAKALLGDPPRAYRHGEAPPKVAPDYVTWFVVAGTPENELSGVPGIDRQSVQVDCWSDTDTGVAALAVAVRNAIEPYAHMTAGGTNDGRDPQTKRYRSSMTFDWWLHR